MRDHEPMTAERAEQAFWHIYDGWAAHRNPADFLRDLFGPPPGIFVIDERTQYQTRKEVRQLALRLQNLIHFLPSYLRLLALKPEPLHFSFNTDGNIRLWITSNGSHFMWAEGRTSNDVQLMTLPRMGIRLCGLAYEAGLPMAIFSMYGRPDLGSRSSVSEPPSPVADLVYTLIRQLITYIPRRFERPGTLNTPYFDKLDGTLASVEPALDMLTTLLEYIPPFLVCVIDGLERLENNKTRPYLYMLLNRLRALSTGRRFKILFSTSGPSQVLSEKLNHEEHLSNIFA
ncbi:uncharacterized protein F4807DRAFT_464726 [Annulohypoxylon truncatum]|uniref:uncharacterized protein n=1 Tax=Annulohypoxylon truncatum TaxID=327061 RepID=UPI0020089B0D|nr:uncharacterized protein F4807DRAFT_464726 [Annulohypoxylon truncatum]KAI1205439.1 hypothetical protein F4807DRAFT_464726 [Annulohypoxylon truncatum]